MLGPNEARPQLLALVTWVDSRLGAMGWERLDDMDPLPPVRVVSVGWVIEVADGYIIIAGDLADTQVCGRRTISVSAIIEPVKYFNASKVGK